MNDKPELLKNLTEKEMAVVTFVCEGLSNCEISAKLNISLPTVAAHLSSVYKKVGLYDRGVKESKRIKLIRMFYHSHP